MFNWLSLLTIQNFRDNLREVLLILFLGTIFFQFKLYVDRGDAILKEKDETLKCQLARVQDFKDLRDQAITRMEKVEAKTDSTTKHISALNKRVKR